MVDNTFYFRSCKQYLISCFVTPQTALKENNDKIIMNTRPAYIKNTENKCCKRIWLVGLCGINEALRDLFKWSLASCSTHWLGTCCLLTGLNFPTSHHGRWSVDALFIYFTLPTIKSFLGLHVDICNLSPQYPDQMYRFICPKSAAVGRCLKLCFHVLFLLEIS